MMRLILVLTLIVPACEQTSSVTPTPDAPPAPRIADVPPGVIQLTPGDQLVLATQQQIGNTPSLQHGYEIVLSANSTRDCARAISQAIPLGDAHEFLAGLCEMRDECGRGTERLKAHFGDLSTPTLSTWQHQLCPIDKDSRNERAARICVQMRTKLRANFDRFQAAFMDLSSAPDAITEPLSKCGNGMEFHKGLLIELIDGATNGPFAFNCESLKPAVEQGRRLGIVIARTSVPYLDCEAIDYTGVLVP